MKYEACRLVYYVKHNVDKNCNGTIVADTEEFICPLCEK
jgi:hypothetical protein